MDGAAAARQPGARLRHCNPAGPAEPAGRVQGAIEDCLAMFDAGTK